jgi:hypothetical protein
VLDAVRIRGPRSVAALLALPDLAKVDDLGHRTGAQPDPIIFSACTSASNSSAVT